MRYSNTFVRYTKELSRERYHTLTLPEERELVKKYAAGDEDSFNKLVEGYLRFVMYVLQSYKVPDTVDVMDLIQEGTVGLIAGIKKFDSTRYSCRISTYCIYWIRFYIMKSLDLQSKSRALFVPLGEELSNIGDMSIYDNPKLRESVTRDLTEVTLTGLEKRERFIIEHYYGLVPPYNAKTLQEIGTMLHLNFERIRQIRDVAIAKLKKQETLSIVT